MPALHFWWRYHNQDIRRPPATLCLCFDTAWGHLLSFDGGDWHRDGWRFELNGQSLVLSFNAKGPTFPRHHVRLERRGTNENTVWMGFDYKQRFIRLEPLGGVLDVEVQART